MLTALRRHGPEYLMEAFGLGLFMVSAGSFATLLHHPGSPVRQALPDPVVRRVLNRRRGHRPAGVVELWKLIHAHYRDRQVESLAD